MSGGWIISNEGLWDTLKLKWFKTTPTEVAPVFKGVLTLPDSLMSALCVLKYKQCSWCTWYISAADQQSIVGQNQGVKYLVSITLLTLTGSSL